MKFLPTNITFFQLYKLYNISLHIAVANITTNQLEILNDQTHPNVKVIDGLIASMSLPILYSPFKSASGDYWVDGGIINNFPVCHYVQDTLIGFDTINSSDIPFDTFITYLQRIVKVSRNEIEKIQWDTLPTSIKNRCIIIDTNNLSGLLNAHDLTFDQRNNLTNCGKLAVKKWLSSL